MIQRGELGNVGREKLATNISKKKGNEMSRKSGNKRKEEKLRKQWGGTTTYFLKDGARWIIKPETLKKIEMMKWKERHAKALAR